MVTKSGSLLSYLLKSKYSSAFLIFALVFAFSLPPVAPIVKADTLTMMSDTLSTVKTGVLADHTIKFKMTTGLGAGETITITFASGFNLSTMTGAGQQFTDVDFCSSATSFDDCISSGQKTLAASAGGATWGVGVSGQVLTLTSATGTLTALDYVVIQIGENATGGASNGQITNPTAGSYTISIGGTNGDTGSVVTTIIANDVVTVAATVSAGDTLTFSIDDNAIGFGTLSFLTARYATGDAAGASSDPDNGAHTLAASSSSGYSINVQGGTLSLNGAGVTTIGAMGAAAVYSQGTEQFGMNVEHSGAGTGQVCTGTTFGCGGDYSTGSTYIYTASASTAKKVAGCEGGCSTSDTYYPHYLASISVNTAAGSYSTSLTYVAVGSY